MFDLFWLAVLIVAGAGYVVLPQNLKTSDGPYRTTLTEGEARRLAADIARLAR